jgi:hypothetical protein
MDPVTLCKDSFESFSSLVTSQNTLTAYRRTWLKLIAWAAAECVRPEPR